MINGQTGSLHIRYLFSNLISSLCLLFSCSSFTLCIPQSPIINCYIPTVPAGLLLFFANRAEIP